MGAGALENCYAVGCFPDDEPVPSVGNVTFMCAVPCSFEGVHLMPPLKDVK